MKYQLIVIFILINISTYSQLRLDTLNWRPPVDIPIYLSGNFAELRTGHFHSGIDIKTQGQEGFKLHAVQDGYISRIKVSSGGYGKAIYINHPDGYTSVYAHLKEYNIQLDKYVHEKQYKNKSYEISIFPKKGELTVKQGDIIGLTGNSGSSAGPHLHFEIRDTKSSRPMNGLFLGYDIKDNIPPRMDYLYVYPQNAKSNVNGKNTKHYYSLKKELGKFVLRQGDTLKANGNIGLGLKVNDYLNGSANRCGVYQLKVYNNNTLIFHEKFDGFSFAETRYINSLMDYSVNIERKRKLNKMFIEPNNKLSVYVDNLNNGIINISNENSIQNIRIEAIDAYGNSSDLEFIIQFKPGKKPLATKKSNAIIIPWQQKFTIDTLGLLVHFVKKSFYDTLKMEFSVDTTSFSNVYSYVYSIHNKYTPVHKYFDLSIDYYGVEDSLISKLLLAKRYKNKFIAAGGKAENGKIKGRVRNLGTYAVVIDTIKPTIKPLGAAINTTDLSNKKFISYKIKDDFSGIVNYRGTINGNWVLFEYDAKNNLITYNFDEHMPIDGFAELEITVIDYCGNKAVYTDEFEFYSEPDNEIGQ